jgi:NAD(P)-dependent dehydrogenase (short-subunit alcohol dehydrogenase family)
MRMIPGTVSPFDLNGMHAGHFLLTNLLLENMKSTCRDTGIEGRIVNVASSAHAFSYPEGICFEKIRDPSGSG